MDKVSVIEGNKAIRFSVPPQFMRYIFSKGYIAVNGTSLTVSDVSKSENWFEVWLIPETRRVTVFEEKKVGDRLNVEIERSTQVVVDTVRDTVHEALGKLQPVLGHRFGQRRKQFQNSRFDGFFGLQIFSAMMAMFLKCSADQSAALT